MKKLFSFFKGKSKAESVVPTLLDELFTFKYTKSKLESNLGVILNSSEFSNTLYFEGNVELNDFKFIFIGTKALEYYSHLVNRVETKNVLLCANKESLSRFSNVKNSFLLERPNEIESLTFNKGESWYRSNKIELEKKIANFVKDTKLVVLFVENYGYYLAISKNIIDYFQQLDVIILPVFFLPPKGTSLEQEFYIYSYILTISQMEKGFPFILIDETKLLNKANDNVTIELRKKLAERVPNVILDLLAMVKTHPVLYHADIHNFLSILKDAKGPCVLLSCDVYENNPYLGELVGRKGISSFNFEQLPVRGFVGIQPSPKGLLTMEYQKIRKFFANKDLFVSIYPERSQGSIIRGLLSFTPYPSSFLKSIEELFSGIAITISNETGEQEEELTVSESTFKKVINSPRILIRPLTALEDSKET